MKEWDRELFEEFVSQIETISRGEYNADSFKKFMRIGAPNSLRQPGDGAGQPFPAV